MAKTVQVGAKPGMAAHTPGKRYADPGYQQDGRKRYALDTPDEIRAALSYIGMARNRAKYKPADLKKVEAAINAAAAKAGIGASAVPTETQAASQFVARMKAARSAKAAA